MYNWTTFVGFKPDCSFYSSRGPNVKYKNIYTGSSI